MKKLFLSIFICLFSAIPVFSDVLEDNYFSASYGMICLDKSFVYNLLGWTKPGNEISADAIKAVTESIQERFNFNIDKDIENVGICVLPVKYYGPNAIYFITGKLQSKRIIKMLQLSHATDAIKNFEEKTIKVNDKEYKGFSIDNGLFVFLNDNFIVFSRESVIEHYLEDATFTKAPDEISDLKKRAGSFLLISHNTTAMLKGQPIIPQEINAIKDCECISLYIKDYYLNIVISFKNGESTEKLKTQLEAYKSGFVARFQKDFDEAKNGIKGATVKEVPEQYRKLYTAGSYIDNINSIKVTSDDKATIISIPFGISTVGLGFTTYLTGYLIPEILEKLPATRCKNCMSAIRKINEAVELYTLDKGVLMETLDINKLLEGHYLHGMPDGVGPECEYYSEGDLSKDGCIKCKKHGSLDKPIYK